MAKDKAKAAALEIAQSFLTTGKAVVESVDKTGEALRNALVTPIQGAAATVATLVAEAKKGFDELRTTAGSLWSPPSLPGAKPGECYAVREAGPGHYEVAMVIPAPKKTKPKRAEIDDLLTTAALTPRMNWEQLRSLTREP